MTGTPARRSIPATASATGALNGGLAQFIYSFGLGAIPSGTAYGIGTPFGVNGFIAAIIGGFGRAGGALAGGLMLGLAQALAIVLLGAGFKNVAALSVLILVLLLFPNGIFTGLKEMARSRAS